MSKHYDIRYGVRETNRLRRFMLGTASAGLLGIGVYFTQFNAPSVTTAGQNKEASSVVVQPAPVEQLELTTPMPWPAYGHAAFGVPEKSIIAASDNEPQAVPIASLAKVITALAVLKEKPLSPGEQGPLITLTEQDVALYGEYIRKNGTVVPVEAGEQISQYQALQAILMPSANNMSDSLTRWAFGSDEKYVEYANKMLKDLGLAKTVVADASGYSPQTVGTADEMTKLGFLFMQNPVLRQITLEPHATIPIAGIIRNYNSFSNQEGIFGIKVGDTDEAGKCFMVANIRQVGGSAEEISIAVVLGANNLRIAADDAQAILKAGNNGYDQLPKLP